MSQDNNIWKKVAIVGGVGIGVGVGVVAATKWIKSRNESYCSKVFDLKELGNTCFRDKKYEEAVKHFDEALRYKKYGEATVVAMCYQNKAACLEKQNAPRDVLIKCCEDAIAYNVKYAKAHYRLARYLATEAQHMKALIHAGCAIYLDNTYNRSDIFGGIVPFIERDIVAAEQLNLPESPVDVNAIFPWLYAWDLRDLIKEGLGSTKVGTTAEEKRYYAALKHIKNEEYEKVLRELGDEPTDLKNMILAFKFCQYSHLKTKTQALEQKLDELVGNLVYDEGNDETIKLIESYLIAKAELLRNTSENDQLLAVVASKYPKNLARLQSFAMIHLHAILRDARVVTDERQDLETTSRWALAIYDVLPPSLLTPNMKFAATFARFFVDGLLADDYMHVHSGMMEMERMNQDPDYQNIFVYLHMSKIFFWLSDEMNAAAFLTRCNESGNKMGKIQSVLQTIRMQLVDRPAFDDRSIEVLCKRVIDIDAYNFEANLFMCELKLSNIADGACTKTLYEEALPYFDRSAVLLDIGDRHLWSTQRSMLEATKDAAIILGIYDN